ncbi:MAG TPA: hypothetical protein VN906_05385, partial [Candidatus Sulfotelmatobacter sp.]|nr:hypothetical protein [Candidatus Sulfotelmatobacter sp.]
VDYNADKVDSFTTHLAARIDELLVDTDLAARMGKAGRQRVVRHFGWPAVASKTLELYESLL